MTIDQDWQATSDVLQEVVNERYRQDQKWGEQNHPNGTGRRMSAELAKGARDRCEAAFKQGQGTWRHILEEEVAEAIAEDDDAKLRAELIQVAAVAAAWVEAIDRRAVPSPKFGAWTGSEVNRHEIKHDLGTESVRVTCYARDSFAGGEEVIPQLIEVVDANHIIVFGFGIARVLIEPL